MFLIIDVCGWVCNKRRMTTTLDATTFSSGDDANDCTNINMRTRCILHRDVFSAWAIFCGTEEIQKCFVNFQMDTKLMGLIIRRRIPNRSSDVDSWQNEVLGSVGLPSTHPYRLSSLERPKLLDTYTVAKRAAEVCKIALMFSRADGRRWSYQIFNRLIDVKPSVRYGKFYRCQTDPSNFIIGNRAWDMVNFMR